MLVLHWRDTQLLSSRTPVSSPLGRSLDYIFVSSRDIDVVDEGLSVSHFSDHKALLGRVAER